MRSFRRDESVKNKQLPKGIVKRIGGFARPYRVQLGVFLVLIVVSAVIGAANPLIVRAIIDDGIGKHRPDVAIVLALVVGGLAVVNAVLTLWQRWISARIGEGLIYDMRTKVFTHVGQMPLAFFTRTQTGALISRLNNDVLGAQQAFTDTFSSVVGNLITVAVTLGGDVRPLLADHFAVARDAAGLHLPVTLGGPAPASADARELLAQRRDEHDDERSASTSRVRCSSSCSATRARRRRSSIGGQAASATSASHRPCTAASS